MEPHEYLTTAEVAKTLRICASTAQKMARAGKLVAVKVGKLWRFPPQSLAIRMYKQKQAAERMSSGTGEKSGWKEFLKSASDLGLIEPIDRAHLYRRGGS